MNETVGAAVVINRYFQNGETACCQLSKRLPDKAPFFAAEVAAITPVLNCYQHMGPVHHDVVSYSKSMSFCRQMKVKILGTLLFAKSWTCSGYWVRRAHVSFLLDTKPLGEVEVLAN